MDFLSGLVDGQYVTHPQGIPLPFVNRYNIQYADLGDAASHCDHVRIVELGTGCLWLKGSVKRGLGNGQHAVTDTNFLTHFRHRHGSQASGRYAIVQHRLSDIADKYAQALTRYRVGQLS